MEGGPEVRCRTVCVKRRDAALAYPSIQTDPLTYYTIFSCHLANILNLHFPLETPPAVEYGCPVCVHTSTEESFAVHCRAYAQ